MRIAVSSSTFRRPLAAAELTQLEWLEGCASNLGADGVVADVADFPRRDAEYVAQLRKVAVDLGLVPFGLDAAGLLDPSAAAERDEILSIAVGFGAAIVRTALPAPGAVPPAAFAAAVAAGKALGRAAKGVNVTVVVAAAAGTLGEDFGGIKRLLKDVDSAWLRACPPAAARPRAARHEGPLPGLCRERERRSAGGRSTRRTRLGDPGRAGNRGAVGSARPGGRGRLREAEARQRLGPST